MKTHGSDVPPIRGRAAKPDDYSSRGYTQDSMSASPGDSSEWVDADRSVDPYGVHRYEEPSPISGHDQPWDYHAGAAIVPISPSYAPPYGPPPMGYHAGHHHGQYHPAAVPVHAVHHGGVGMPAEAAYGTQVGWGREMSDARSDAYYYH